MLSSYFYGAGATAANILADQVAILTGETNVANLSASCDKVNTVIDASVTVAGWTLHDAAAGTNAVCLKAAMADNASQYKYLVVDTNTAGYIFLKGYETWDAEGHSGTNLIYRSDGNAYSQRINTTLGGRLDISASVRHCFAYSYQNGLYGSSTGTAPCGILERTRRSPWDTVANGYPPFVFMSGFNTNISYEPRSLSAAGSDVVASYAAATPIHFLGVLTNPSTTVPSDELKTPKHMMIPFGVARIADGHLGGDISSLCDIWLTTYNSGSTYDTLVVGSATYMIWAVAATWRFAVRKG